ncbi:MAG: hypothetical protein JSR66_08450 [Proteobacteria bacterium]|nr:hypothetical protein [Pseudomonadota bacterium]
MSKLHWLLIVVEVDLRPPALALALFVVVHAALRILGWYSTRPTQSRSDCLLFGSAERIHRPTRRVPT